ncbi:hypothetical protein MCOR02_008259 [Pyricularia oryzae]|nr:hypothetical protein MCOR02_008259 [Pyricularia oryzae]KAI6294017.1 hypothetical protein MCOR34_009768 [Pyricularia oryzae]KAI6453577.1 hypothetical protein MCOR17_009230 [Pyricularia oryzae]KAI6496601.1 hypothetical protein MCOR13_006980 [Pyricularia oryzae]KAI6589728.1 hypothetical protein MCOR04_003958 [Pyricularia oryzae]
MEERDADPFNFDTERLVKELCTDNRSWKPSQPEKCPNRVLLEAKIRESEADGEFLIWESEESGSFKDVYDQFEIKKVPHKRFIRQAAEHFRKRSRKYKQKLAELRGKDPAEDDLPAELPAFAQATAATVAPEPAQKKRRIAPTQLSETPVHAEPVRILTEADVIKHADASSINRKVATVKLSKCRNAPRYQYYSAAPITSSHFEPDLDDDDREFQFASGTYDNLPGHSLAISRGIQRYFGVRLKTETTLPQDEEHPLFGESGSEAGYDSDTMQEIEAEKTERAHASQQSQTERREDVAEALRAVLSDLEVQWRTEKLPKLNAKANKIWNEARSRRSSRINMIEKARITSHHLQARLAKMCTQIEEDPNFRSKDVVTVRQAFENTVYEKLETEWRADLLSRTSEPERVVTRRVRREKAPRVVLEDGVEGDVLTSDSDSDGFIVEDAMENAPQGKEEKEEETSAAGEHEADSAPSPIDLTLDTPKKPRDDSSASDISDEEPSPSKKRRVKRDKAAQDMRDLDRRRMEEQEERSRELRAQLAKSDMSGLQSRLIINEAKKASQGFIYVPEPIAQNIKDHQIEGVRFMWNQVVNDDRSQGCLLAHTMGLGKTVQVICLLVAIQHAAQSPDPSVVSQIPKELQRSQTLVLCPPGLLNNWLDEFSRWVEPYDALGRIYKIDSEIPAEARAASIEPWVNTGGILLMGYSLFRSLVSSGDSKMQTWLTELPSIVVADEAHTIKNERSKISEAMANFKAKAKIAMTGSPLANSVGDYFSMINWVAPNYLGPRKEFTHFFASPIQEGLFVDSSPAEKRRAMKLLKALKDTVSPKVHRMTTTALRGQLPEKREYVIVVPLTEYQKSAYEVYMRWVATRADATTVSLLGYICQLSTLLVHPRIFLQYFVELANEYDKDVRKSDSGREIPRHVIGNLIAEVNRRDIHNLDHSYKITVLTRILDEAKRVGDKVLIFSSRIPVLNFLENLMKMQKRPYSRLDGETKISTRQASVANFNANNDEVYLISTNAGGVGLNIQGANRVVMMDFQWQPANEQQAIGRAYRIGQTKPVYVYWLIVGGTYEPKLHAAAIFKTQLASRVVDKKNPNPHAPKVKTWMQPPEIVKREEATLVKVRGSDPEVLDHILDSPTSGQICKIMIGDIFEQEEPDHQLSPEELKEAVDLVKMNRLRITNPEEYNRLMQPALVPAHPFPGPLNIAAVHPHGHAPMALNSQQVTGLREQGGGDVGMKPRTPSKIILHLPRTSTSTTSYLPHEAGPGYPLPLPKANTEVMGQGPTTTEAGSEQVPPIPGAGTFTKPQPQERGPIKTGALGTDWGDRFLQEALKTMWGTSLMTRDLYKLAIQVQRAIEAKNLSGLPGLNSLRLLLLAFQDETILECVLSGQLQIDRLVTAKKAEFDAQLAKAKGEAPSQDGPGSNTLPVPQPTASITSGLGLIPTQARVLNATASPSPVLPPTTEKSSSGSHSTDSIRGSISGPKSPGSTAQNPLTNPVRPSQSNPGSSTKQSRPNRTGLNPHAQTPSQATQEILDRKAKKKKKKKLKLKTETEREPRLPEWANKVSGGMASESTNRDTRSSLSRLGDSKDTPMVLDDD